MPGVLIVEDSPTNCALLAAMLEETYDCLMAGSGQEALRQAEQHGPDVILLDILLPDIDGYEVCRRLRRIKRLAHSKIVMISGKKMGVEDRLRGYQAGADDYLCKPFEQEELLAKVRVFMRLKSAEEMEQLKSNVLSLLSRETQTPVREMLDPAAELARDGTLSAQQRQLALRIHEGAQRLSSLFEKVQALGTLKSGGYVGTPAPCDLVAIVRATVEKVGLKAMSRGIEVVFDPSVQRPVLADRMDVTMAFAILLENAVRFSPDEDRVVVTLDEVDDRVRLEVTDHGPGLDEELADQVFQVFGSADVDQQFRGLHLSLPIAHHLVQMYGGTLSVQSRPGETTFTLILPAAPVPTPVA